MRPITLLFLISGVTFAVGNYVATKLHLYWYLWWSDFAMHALGGFVVALAIPAVWPGFSYVAVRTQRVITLLLLGAAVASWELYELYLGSPRYSNYALDTVGDVSLGLLGGLVGYGIIRSKYMK